MNAEYQRLEADASEVERELRDLVTTVELRSVSGLSTFENQVANHGRKLASFRLGMALIRAVNSPEMQKREREFIKNLPKRFHSQGTRTKLVHLPENVTVTLSITYYHRCKTQKAGQKDRRGNGN